MEYRGQFSNGVIRLEGGVILPEGTEVVVHTAPTSACAGNDLAIPTLFERLQDLVGKAEGLPADLSVNHDHYLYGAPKRP